MIKNNGLQGPKELRGIKTGNGGRIIIDSGGSSKENVKQQKKNIWHKYCFDFKHVKDPLW